MSRRVWLPVGAVAVVVICGGWMAFGSGKFSDDKPAFHLDKTRVERGDVIGKVTATGTVAALVTVQVGSQVSGRIAELKADFGSRVHEGQVIAKLDARLFAAAAEQSRANRDAAAGKLAEVRAKAANAERQLQRTQELAAQKLVSEAELDNKTAEAAQE